MDSIFKYINECDDLLTDKYELHIMADDFNYRWKIMVRSKKDNNFYASKYIDIFRMKVYLRSAITDCISEIEEDIKLKEKQEPLKLRRVVAIDFDGTLCESAYPDVGVVEKTHLLVHDLIHKEKANGSIIILWTCRCGKELEEAVAACKDWHIPIDYVNENDPERTKYFGADSRKISADLYIDDRATNPEEWED
jgi:hypothetical protein